MTGRTLRREERLTVRGPIRNPTQGGGESGAEAWEEEVWRGIREGEFVPNP